MTLHGIVGKMSSVTRGRGHRKRKPNVRKVRTEHGTAIVSIPQRILQKAGVVMNTNVELTVEYTDPNPLRREVKLVFSKPKPEDLANQLVKRDGKSKR